MRRNGPDQMSAQTINFQCYPSDPYGRRLEEPYIVFGFGKRPIDFSDVRYPRRSTGLREVLHQPVRSRIPLPDQRLNFINTQAFINPEGPITADGTGWHTEKNTAAHHPR